MVPLNVLLHGTDTPPQALAPLRAGAVSLLFDPACGALRYLSVGDHEVLRGIYGAVRDRNWGTVAPVLHDLKIDNTSDSFEITFAAQCQAGEVDFAWAALIEGRCESDGLASTTQIRFVMDGRARSAFLRNRIGLCVLHPISCAGRNCTIETVDGKVIRGTFPSPISPHQPFKRILAISHQVAPGVEAELRLEGDVFEMEDQRNWTDASFKAYGTPLELPYPMPVSAGDRVSQTVTLRVRAEHPTEGSGRIVTPAVLRDDAVSIALDRFGERKVVPQIGFGLASHDEPLNDLQIERLKALAPKHLRVDLRLFEPDWDRVLTQGEQQAALLETSLELALWVGHRVEDELCGVAVRMKQLRAPVSTVLLFHRDQPCVPEEVFRQARRHLDASAKLGAGSNANFAELNRHPPPLSLLDLVCYPINPQVHASDDLSLMETLEAQAQTVRSARRLSGELPVAVTPVTLRPRFNAVATAPESPGPGKLPPQVDPRQMSLLGAAWTLGSMKRLFEGGAHSVTFYETTGWRGVMELPGGSLAPDRFRSLPNSVFPMYHVFADVAEFAGGELIPLSSADPRRIDGIALSRQGSTRILLANLTACAQAFTLRAGPCRCRIRLLDETHALLAMQSPETYRSMEDWVDQRDDLMEMELRPYAVACVDLQD